METQFHYAEARVIVNEQCEFKLKFEGYTHRYDFAHTQHR